MAEPGKVVLITGASGHLGRAVAMAFAAAGYRLVLTGTSLAGLRAAFPSASADWLLVAADLAGSAGAEQPLAAALDVTGRIDALCALAGAFTMGEPVHELSETSWETMLGANVRTLLAAVRAAAPRMIAQGHGRIVTVGAASALHGSAGMGAYAAAKSAVMRLTESLAAELGPHGINVNGVLPGIIDTAPNRAAMPNADRAKWVKPEDLAAVIRFLASDEARAVHGVLLPVTGRG